MFGLSVTGVARPSRTPKRRSISSAKIKVRLDGIWPSARRTSMCDALAAASTNSLVPVMALSHLRGSRRRARSKTVAVHWEVGACDSLTYHIKTVDVASQRPHDSIDAAAIVSHPEGVPGLDGHGWGSSSQHCSQQDAATKQHRSRKQSYGNPSLNSRASIGSANIPNALWASAGNVTDVL